MYQWEWSWLWKFRDELLRACLFTLELNACVIIGSICVGLGLCALRVATPAVIRKPVVFLVEFLRALPVLILMIWMFFCLPILFRDVLNYPIRLTAWTTAVIALAMNMGAYFSEVFRAGLAAIPTGEIQAGYVCGLSRWDIARRIAIPHTLRSILPPLANQCATAIKLSSLASFIAVPEILYTANSLIHETFRPLEFYTFVALAYLAIILPVTGIAAWAERRYGVQHG